MRSYPVKKKHNGSEVSEFLGYRQTNILLLYYKDRIGSILQTFSHTHTHTQAWELINNETILMRTLNIAFEGKEFN